MLRAAPCTSLCQNHSGRTVVGASFHQSHAWTPLRSASTLSLSLDKQLPELHVPTGKMDSSGCYLASFVRIEHVSDHVNSGDDNWRPVTAGA